MPTPSEPAESPFANFTDSQLLELKNDLHAGSSLLASLGTPTLHVERLVLIADNQTRQPEAGAGAASVAAALEAANALGASAVAADEAEEDEAPATEASAALQRLASALSQHHAHLEELDASYNSLGSALQLDAPGLPRLRRLLLSGNCLTTLRLDPECAPRPG